MNIARASGRVAAVLATVSALTALAGVAQAGVSGPVSTSQAEQTALRVRSEALNEKYGLGEERAVHQGMTAAASRALRLRSEALNEKYGVGRQKAATVTSQPTSSTRGFAWGAFGMGAAMTVGLALLAGGLFARRRFLATLRGLAPRYRTT